MYIKNEKIGTKLLVGYEVHVQIVASQVQIAYLAVISNLEKLVQLTCSYTLSMQIRPLANSP